MAGREMSQKRKERKHLIVVPLEDGNPLGNLLSDMLNCRQSARLTTSLTTSASLSAASIQAYSDDTVYPREIGPLT